MRVISRQITVEVMGTEDINFEDRWSRGKPWLQVGEPHAPKRTLRRWRTGFPRHGGLKGLEAVEKMADQGPRSWRRGAAGVPSEP